MFELNGVEITMQDLELAASRQNMDFDTYLEIMKKENGLVKKLNGSTEATPTGGPIAMGSESDDGSSVLLDRISKIESGEIKPEEEKDELEVLKTIPNYYSEDRITPDSNIGYFPTDNTQDPLIQPTDQITNQIFLVDAARQSMAADGENNC